MDVYTEFNAAFDEAIAADVAESGYQVTDWFKSGVSSPETAIANWRQLGPKVCRNFTDWYETSGYRVWEAPDGRPAIELELDVMFGDIPNKMFIDAILEHIADRHLLVLDSKSGAVVPVSPQQLGFYACGVELMWDIRPRLGAYFMARGAGRNKDIFLTEPVDLYGPELSVEFFTKQLQAMERGRGAEAFIARVGKHCERCDVARYCTAVGGEYAALVDPDHPFYDGE